MGKRMGIYEKHKLPKSVRVPVRNNVQKRGTIAEQENRVKKHEQKLSRGEEFQSK